MSSSKSSFMLSQLLPSSSVGGSMKPESRKDASFAVLDVIVLQVRRVASVIICPSRMLINPSRLAAEGRSHFIMSNVVCRVRSTERDVSGSEYRQGSSSTCSSKAAIFRSL